VPEPAATIDCPRRNICFDVNNCQAIYGEDFQGLRDSLSALVAAGKRILITGIYATSETNSSGSADLGICRAEGVKARLAETIDATKIDVASESTVGVNLEPNEKIRFSATAEVTANVASSTQIYFPFNSTNKLDDRDVEAYLREVATRVKASGERVRLTGHTDNIGSDESNQQLGLRRAQVVADYLKAQGVASNKIVIESAGESRPVATNETEVGRAKNRRTELQII
jgi:outer membrane protein OmpA-like peptidoglycan-associated protein